MVDFTAAIGYSAEEVVRLAKVMAEELNQVSFQKGVDKGHTEGYERGYANGYDKGFEEGYEAGKMFGRSGSPEARAAAGVLDGGAHSLRNGER